VIKIKDAVEIKKDRQKPQRQETQKKHSGEVDIKQISDKVHANIVRIKEKEKKSLDAKRDIRKNPPKDQMGNVKNSPKGQDTLSDLSENYKISKETAKRLSRQELGVKNYREQFSDSTLIKNDNRKRENEIINTREYTTQDIKDQLFKENKKKVGPQNLSENFENTNENTNEFKENWEPCDDFEYKNKDYFDNNWDPGLDSDYEDKDALCEEKDNIGENYKEITSETIKEDILKDILNRSSSEIQSFNESLRESLYKNTNLSLSEKSKIIKFSQNEDLTEEEREDFHSILSKLSTEELEEYINKDIKDISMVDKEYNDLNNDDEINDEFKENNRISQDSIEKVEVRNTCNKIERVKEEIKNIDWNEISNDWMIKQRKNQYSEVETIHLDPTQDTSKENPLYKHKEWLQRVYNDKNLNLTDKQIAEICGVDQSVIGKWRNKLDIPTKLRGEGKWIDTRSGRAYVRVPEDYDHPELKDFKGRKRGYRLEHIYNIEQHLAKHPEWEISKECLVDGKYLKTECEVHHINQIPTDNRIENLWVYKSKMEHAEGELTLHNSLKALIKQEQIKFSEGIYRINQDVDNLKERDFSNSEVDKPINFKDLDLVKEDIKKINWNEISNNWIVKERVNQFLERETLVDPFKECSITNPLYKHKDWVEHIVNKTKYNLTDSRLGELCGISRDKARYWRDKIHNIEGKKNWGYDRFVDKTDGRIWTKVPSDYENPVVRKDNHQRKFMLEHRYVMERYLAEHPELEISNKILKDDKFLKSEYQVHHINLDYQDNRIENLYVFEDQNQHDEASRSLHALVDDLLKQEILIFKDGKYYLKT